MNKEQALLEFKKATDADDELMEGIKDIFQKFRMKRYLAKFLEKGQDTVYFAYSKESRTFAKAVFNNGKLEDTQRYQSLDEMEADIAMYETEGYRPVKEGGLKSILKMIVRNVGRLVMGVGIANFIAYTIMGIAGGLAVVPIAVLAAPAFAITMTAGWVLTKVGEKDTALDRDYAGVGRNLSESESIEEFVREKVRDEIKKQALEACNEKPKSEDS